MSYLGACAGCSGLGLTASDIVHPGPCTAAELRAGNINSPYGCAASGSVIEDSGPTGKPAWMSESSPISPSGKPSGAAPSTPVVPSSDLVPSPYRAQATILGIPRVPFLIGAGVVTVFGIALALKSRGRRGRRR